MSDKTTELLPCPICGRKATVSSWWSDAEECGIAGVGCSRESYANGYECARIIVMRIDEKTALEDAIRIWNTRAAHGTLTAEQVREAIEANSWAETSTIREFNDSSWQAIADELNAELGSGTCEMAEVLEHEDDGGYIWYDHWECSECGGKNNGILVSFDQVAPPKNCPNCGRRVKL